MLETYHIRAKNEYAVSLLELLKRDNAIEDLELHHYELSDGQKEAVDIELVRIDNDPNYLKKWEDRKQCFKKS